MMKTEKTNDLISRADAIEAICNAQCELDVPHYPQCDQIKWCDEVKALLALPSAEADSDDLIIKGAKGIKDGLYNIKDGKLFKYKAKGGIVQAYEIVPSAEAISNEGCPTIYTNPERETGRWIPCSERLPMMGDYVLTYRPIMGMRMIVDAYEGYYGEDDDEWYEGWIYGGDKVIAWMPLPEPYEGGEDE